MWTLLENSYLPTKITYGIKFVGNYIRNAYDIATKIFSLNHLQTTYILVTKIISVGNPLLITYTIPTNNNTINSKLVWCSYFVGIYLRHSDGKLKYPNFLIDLKVL